MNADPFNVTAGDARAALLEYRRHRAVHDARDKEISRIYYAISRGRKVISVNDAIVRGGIDEMGRPHLAIMRADQETVRCGAWHSGVVDFTTDPRSRSGDLNFDIPWPDRAVLHPGFLRALLPRIPPQYRPAKQELSKYHVLWEADWTSIPRDPLLLKRIGKDAWVVLAAWNLTDVELNVLRAHHE